MTTKQKADRMREIIGHGLDLYEIKNNDYGDAFGKGYQMFGGVSCVNRLFDKCFRLKALLVDNQSQQVSDESITDTLVDLANYALMTIVELEGDKPITSQETLKEQNKRLYSASQEDGYALYLPHTTADRVYQDGKPLYSLSEIDELILAEFILLTVCEYHIIFLSTVHNLSPPYNPPSLFSRGTYLCPRVEAEVNSPVLGV